MNRAPVGGYEHGPQCDEGLPERMCETCWAEVDRDWTTPEGDEDPTDPEETP